MGLSSFFFLLLFIALILALFAIIILIILKIYNFIKNRGYKKIGLIIIAIISIAFLYPLYAAFYPTDDFYFDEFKEVTLRQIPESAEIIKKSTSYPDFHGNYCSSSQIKISKKDYLILLNYLLKDHKFTTDTRKIGSPEFSYTLGNIKIEQLKYNIVRKEKESHYLYIGFLGDQETIFINRYVL